MIDLVGNRREGGREGVETDFSLPLFVFVDILSRRWQWEVGKEGPDPLPWGPHAIVIVRNVKRNH